MFKSVKNRANRAFAKGARILTNGGTYRLLVDSTCAASTGPKLAPNHFPTPTQKTYAERSLCAHRPAPTLALA